MTCRELMTLDPAVCAPSDNVVRAAMLMKQHNVGSIPVVANTYDTKLVGIITDRDLTLRVIAEQRDYYNTRIEEVMTHDPVTCRDDDDSDAVLKAMKISQIRRIPVVDHEQKLIGIIAQADVARSVEERKVAAVLEAVSDPNGMHAGPDAARIGLWIAGGLSVGAGLVYALQRGSRSTAA